VDRWALLVGISNYAHEDLNLRFAARDAQKLRETLLKPTAGAFPDDHVLPLIDDEATLANLTKALRTFLKRPAEDDLVVLFVACHGSRDRDRPDNLYLLPHDTDPEDISGTALPMREVELALQETLLSRRVVILADTCHSGGLGGAFAGIRGAHDDAADLNTYLGALSTSRGGVSLMTSAMAAESSLEGKQWGDGHGVFTHFLLEGLAGKADRGPPYDSVITVGELFDFVQRRVKEETEGKQHPHISADSDRGLVLAVTGSLSARQHLELAERLGQAAELLGEPACWRGAAVQYGEAIRLGQLEEHRIQHALALFRSGDGQAAERALEAIPPPDARLNLGLVQLARGDTNEARATLLTPKPLQDWVEVLFSSSLPHGRRLALLIGVDRVDPAAFSGWEGQLMTPVAEVKALAEVLRSEFQFDELIELHTESATGDAVRNALNEVVARSAAYDAIVVCLSGHGALVPTTGETDYENDSTFVAHDEQITSAEIDQLLSQTAAGRTTLIASCGHSGRFVERARTSGYEAIASCRQDQVDMDGTELSAFMQALLPQLKPDNDISMLARKVREDLGDTINTQEPQFGLDPERPLLVGEIKGEASASGGAVMAQSILGVTAALSAATLDQVSDLLTQAVFPDTAATAIVAERWRRGEVGRLGELAAGLKSSSPTIAFASASGAAHGSVSEDLTDALVRVGALAAVAADAELLAELQTLAPAKHERSDTAARLNAVLIGLSRLDAERQGVKSASDNVSAVQTALLDAGTPAENVAVLIDGGATAQAIRTALRSAAGAHKHSPVFVYWCGPGTLAEMHCFDGQAIDEAEVAALAGSTVTLVGEGLTAPPPDSYLPAPDRPRLTLLSPTSNRKPAGTSWQPRLDGQPGKARYGRLTLSLVTAIQRAHGLADIQANDVAEAASVIGSANEKLLADPLADRVDDAISRARNAELDATATLVAQLLEQRNGIDPEAQLQLGILCAEVGKIDDAVRALERSIDQFGDDARGEATARLHLGRVLLDSGRDRARSVSECRLAAQRDAQLVAAWFWLGRALAELVKHETATEASAALRTYLARGAPIGRRNEVMEMLGSMSTKAATADAVRVGQSEKPGSEADQFPSSDPDPWRMP
jgi:Caspase domain